MTVPQRPRAATSLAAVPPGLGSGSRRRLHPPLRNKSQHLCVLWGAEVAFFGRLAVQHLGCRTLLTLRALNKRQK